MRRADENLEEKDQSNENLRNNCDELQEKAQQLSLLIKEVRLYLYLSPVSGITAVLPVNFLVKKFLRLLRHKSVKLSSRLFQTNNYKFSILSNVYDKCSINYTHNS